MGAQDLARLLACAKTRQHAGIESFIRRNAQDMLHPHPFRNIHTQDLVEVWKDEWGHLFPERYKIFGKCQRAERLPKCLWSPPERVAIFKGPLLLFKVFKSLCRQVTISLLRDSNHAGDDSIFDIALMVRAGFRAIRKALDGTMPETLIELLGGIMLADSMRLTQRPNSETPVLGLRK
jgi:hypothetical protein